ncbi:MAG: SDR family NAD(P)-dependent oxidoreductase, partial [Alphaproteobacteria bacterium]
MQLDFTGKRVVVAGGSRGIGRAIALGFAAEGAGVSICARGAEALEATRAELARLGVTAHAAVCDLAQGDAVRRFIGAAAAALGGIDILVNNASGFGASDDEAGWEASIAVDLMATVRASAAALPFLEAAGGGAIVTISSISAYRA